MIECICPNCKKKIGIKLIEEEWIELDRYCYETALRTMAQLEIMKVMMEALSDKENQGTKKLNS